MIWPNGIVTNHWVTMADVLQSICNPLPLSSSQSSIVKEGWLFKRGMCCVIFITGAVLVTFHPHDYSLQENTSRTGGLGILYCLLMVHSWAIETNQKVQWPNLLIILLSRDVKSWVLIVQNHTHSQLEDYNGPLSLNERSMCHQKKKGK